MNISNYYWYFESVIPPRICDMIVQYGKAEKQREIMAITGGFGRDRDLSNLSFNKYNFKVEFGVEGNATINIDRRNNLTLMHSG